MSGWQVHPNSLVRELWFRDYEEAKAFADYIAEHVDDYHRHPDLAITLNRVRVVIANLLVGRAVLAGQRRVRRQTVRAHVYLRHPNRQ